MAFLDELATNATHRNVSVLIYSGNDDSLVAHRGSEGVYPSTPAQTLADSALRLQLLSKYIFALDC